jgi:hypothetical protein
VESLLHSSSTLVAGGRQKIRLDLEESSHWNKLQVSSNEDFLLPYDQVLNKSLILGSNR